MPIEKKGQHLYQVDRVREGQKRVKTYHKLSPDEPWAMEHQKDYDPNWRDNTLLESAPRTGYALDPSLPCTKFNGICQIRLHPGAPWVCDFERNCPFLIRKGD